MDGRIAIELSSTTPLAFRITSRDAGDVHLAHFSVFEANSSRPLWWIVSRAWADATSFQPMWLDLTPDSDRDTSDGSGTDDFLDPIEDLPPSDPRHQFAIRGPLDEIEDLPASDPRHRAALRRLQINELELRHPLAAVVFGVVPSGFREVFPGSGQPDALHRAVSYIAVADGLTNEGRIAFSLP